LDYLTFDGEPSKNLVFVGGGFSLAATDTARSSFRRLTNRFCNTKTSARTRNLRRDRGHWTKGEIEYALVRVVTVDIERMNIDVEDVLKLPRRPVCGLQRTAYQPAFSAEVITRARVELFGGAYDSVRASELAAASRLYNRLLVQ
jgi:hypothetical protein